MHKLVVLQIQFQKWCNKVCNMYNVNTTFEIGSGPRSN
jgi:hypothetical protein